MMYRLISFIGLFVLMSIAFILSTSRKHINWRTITMGVVLQFIIGIFVIKTGIGKALFSDVASIVNKIIAFTDKGASFVFGSLTDIKSMGLIFATDVLPPIIFISALMSILYYLGVMQKIVKWTAWIMIKLMGTSGSETLSAAANIFVGPCASPLIVKPYVEKMTRSELMVMMTTGMATIAGAVMVAYIKMGIDADNLLAASVMSAPAALVCAKLMIPETNKSETKGIVEVSLPKTSTNVIDAAASGTAEGLKLALNVGAMLIAFIALVAMCNGLLGWVGSWFGIPNLTFQLILGYLFSPIAFLLGVPWKEALSVGTMLGEKVILNEFVAYVNLQSQLTILSPRAVTITTYALCGFSNLSTIGMSLGAIAAIAPSRQSVLAHLSLRALIAANLACMMTACIAGILI